MTCRILAICDTEPVYADFLTKQLLRLPDQDIQIRNFTSMEQLIAFSQVEEITFLILAEEYLADRNKFSSKVCCCLSSKRKVIKEEEDVVYIYRYQTADEIYKEICKNEYAYERIQGKQYKKKQNSWECYGVFHPVHRNGQTTFAKSLSSVLHTKSSRVLYLGLEQYTRIGDENVNLSDLLYYVKQNQDNVVTKLEEFTVQGENYDYVRPMKVGQAVKNITLNEWMTLIRIIQESGNYEVLVIDMDSSLQGYLEILENCEKVYLPIREDVGGEEKLAQFEENLLLLKKDKLKERMEYIYLPTFTALEKDEVQKNIEIFVARLLRRGY